MKKSEGFPNDPIFDEDDYCIGISEAGPPNGDPDPEDERNNVYWYPVKLRNYLNEVTPRISLLIEYYANGQLCDVYKLPPRIIDAVDDFEIPLVISKNVQDATIMARIYIYPVNKIDQKRLLGGLTLYLGRNLPLRKIDCEFGPVSKSKKQVVSP